MERRLLGLAAAIGLTVGIVLLPGTAGATLSGPAYSGDFPDPSVMPVTTASGTNYYAYSTNVPPTNIPTMNSTNPSTFSGPVKDALPNPKLPSWASSGVTTWAPSVVQKGPSSFLMYYTAHDKDHNTQCISVASASSPGGPFTDNSKRPLVCQWNTGSIDPDYFADISGTSYLIWKSDDNSIGSPVTHLWGQQLAPNGLSLLRSPVQLLTADESWQGGIIEGPALVLAGGAYYLFYGANSYSSSSSAIGYAICTKGPLAPCTEKSTNPWLQTNSVPGLVGPQGPSFFTDPSNVEHIAFDAWNGPVGYSNGGVRSMWTDTISFPSGKPTLG
jgi:beta-xylosidase